MKLRITTQLFGRLIARRLSDKSDIVNKIPTSVY